MGPIEKRGPRLNNPSMGVSYTMLDIVNTAKGGVVFGGSKRMIFREARGWYSGKQGGEG